LVFDRLTSGDRLILVGEQATPLLVCIVWATEAGASEFGAKSTLIDYLAEACERNNPRSTDQPIEPPHTDVDQILAPLFDHQRSPSKRRKIAALWSLDAIIHLFCRRGERAMLESRWAMLTKLETMRFRPKLINDLLLWSEITGTEDQRKLHKTESWARLQSESRQDFSPLLPEIIQSDPEFGLIFFMAYPHRNCSALLGFLDQFFARENRARTTTCVVTHKALPPAHSH
jgi:hypothetical protein